MTEKPYTPEPARTAAEKAAADRARIDKAAADKLAAKKEADIVSNPRSPGAWTASTRYDTGAVVRPLVDNHYHYTAEKAGTSGSKEPLWQDLGGAKVQDGGITWIAGPPKS